MGFACARIFSIRIEEETAHTRDLSIKGNNMKNKKMAVAGISLLGSIGVISTGFAGWIIAAQPDTKTGTGSITADATVESKSVKITKAAFGEGAQNDGNIKFGTKKSTLNTGMTEWLSVQNDNEEDLTAKLNVELSLSSVTSVSVYDITLTDNSESKYSAAYDSGKGPVGSLPTFSDNTAPTDDANQGYILVEKSATGNVFNFDGGKVTTSVDRAAKSLSFTIGVYFKWGSLFGNQNPYAYYNNQKWTSDLQSQATTNIEKLQVLSSAVGFTLSFTVSAN